MEKIKKIIFLLMMSLLIPASAGAASLSFTPPSGSYKIGDVFSVVVYIESSDQAMNAASGVVSFPWDKLEVVSISKAGSIFSLWAEEPKYSNTSGTVSFEGIVLNPGYIGANGKVLTITFKAKREGQANLSFSSGSVLANDGSGTNILSSLRVSVLTVASSTGQDTQQILQTPLPIIPESTQANKDELSISSKTHPDQSKWYVNNRPELSWDMSRDILEVRTSISKSASHIPTVSYIPPISEKKLEELSDGTYYFNLQARTVAGWGKISRYQINIDTTPPKPFNITFPHGNESLEPQPIVFFNTVDDGSGISHYDIKIGQDGGLETVAPLALSNPYVLPPQYPGTYTLSVVAVDNAGNARSAFSDFIINSIDVPIITYYPDELEYGDIIKIRGTTYPNSDLTFYFREGDKVVFEDYTKSNSLGNFQFIGSKRMNTGLYTFSVRVTDERGARSGETSPLPLEVRSKIIINLIEMVLNYLSIVILVLLVLSGIFGLMIYIWYRLYRMISNFRREAKEAEKVTHKAFDLLKDDLKSHITKLKRAQLKRKLTAEENTFLRDFQESIEDAESVVSKEINDISELK